MYRSENIIGCKVCAERAHGSTVIFPEVQGIVPNASPFSTEQSKVDGAAKEFQEAPLP